MQNKECADETNTALLAEVSPENGQEVYVDEEQSHEENNSETSKGNIYSLISRTIQHSFIEICTQFTFISFFIIFLEYHTSTINGALEKPVEASICSITVESNEVVNQENMQIEDGSLKSQDLSKEPTSSLSEDMLQVKYK